MTPRIIFFGTPEFAVPALTVLHGAGYDIAAVVTQPDKPVGRGLKMEAPAVKMKAEELGLKVLQPETLRYTEALPPELRRPGLADLGIAVAYGKIIPKAVLDFFPRGILNVHPSLLPKYRGPSPIQAAILNGDTETGVTIMRLDEEMDHGSVLSRNTYHITRITTGGELSVTLAQEGAKRLVEILPKYREGKITPQPQDHSKATYTKLLTREDGKIDWNKPAEHIERLVRAYDLWPGTWTKWHGKRLKILRITMLSPTIGCASNSAPGYVWQPLRSQFPPLPKDFPPCPREGQGGWEGGEGVLAVNCNPGSIILEEIQLEGKKAMHGNEFLRGHPQLLGSIL